MPLPADDNVVKTGDALVKTLRGAFETPASYRPAHAKGRLLRGTFHPSPTARTLSTAPHFTSPSTPLLARFSNSTGLPRIPDSDANANPRGFALRFLLSPDKHKHTDIIAHSTRFFPMRTGDGFLQMLGALGDGSIGTFLEENPSAKAFVQDPKPSPESFATEAYYGVNAFKLVDGHGKGTFVRYRVVPEAGVVTLSEEIVKEKSPTYLFDELSARLRKTPVVFKLLAQIAEVGDPTDDATKHWPEERQQVELGIIELDTELSVEESRKEEKHIIFDPIPRVEGIEPSNDPLLDMRAAVYLISGKERRAAELE